MADQDGGGDRDRDVFADPEVAQRERYADEFGDDGQEVEQEQVTDAEPAPEPAEPLVDQPGVPDAGDRPQPHDHLLVDDQHRHQQQQDPEQAVPVVLARLGVGGDTARVVVADHHDQPGAHDGQEGDQPPPPGAAVLFADPDPAERALDVSQVRLVEDRARAGQRRLLLARPRFPARLRRRRIPLLGLLPGLWASRRGGGRSALRAGGGLGALPRWWLFAAGASHAPFPAWASGGCAASRRRQSSGRVASSTSSTVMMPIMCRWSSTTGIVIRL